MRAIRDEGTERDPLYATKAPLDTLFCGTSPAPLCDRYGSWMAATGCTEKRHALTALHAARYALSDATTYARLLFPVARVQMATEDACGPAGVPSASIRTDAAAP